MTSVPKIQSFEHLANNIGRVIKTKGSFLGRECEILYENSGLSTTEVVKSIETVFDRLVSITSPKTVELAALRAALKIYGWMDLYDRCDLSLLSYGIPPDFAALIQKIDSIALAIPPSSNQSSPLRYALQKLYDDYSQMEAKQFYSSQNLQKVQKLLSLLIIDQRVHKYLEAHHIYVLFDFLCLKEYGATNVRKNSDGQVESFSSKLPESMAVLDEQQRVGFAQGLAATNFGLGLVLTALMTEYHRKSTQPDGSSQILTSKIPPNQALEFCKTFQENLQNPDLGPIQRVYLVYSFKSVFTRINQEGPSESLFAILSNQMDVTEKQNQPLPHGIQDLFLCEAFGKKDEKALKVQAGILRHEQELIALEGGLSSLLEPSPDREEQEDKIQKKKSLLEVLDFVQMSLHHLTQIQNDLEEFTYCLPEYRKLYDCIYDRLFGKTHISHDHQIRTLEYRRPVYEKNLTNWIAFPKSFFNPLLPIAPPLEDKASSSSDALLEPSKKKKRPFVKQNEAPVEVAKQDIRESASSSLATVATSEEALVIPEHRLIYSKWVSCWFTNPEKAIARPQYANIAHLPMVKARVTAFHTFPVEVDQFVFSHGMESTWPDSKTGKDLKHYSIPCEIKFWNETEPYRGSIGYCANEKGEFFHRCFSTKPPNEMVSEFLENGFWNVDFPDLKASLELSKTTTDVQKLRGEGLQVNHVNPYTIEIQDTQNQATIRIFNMKKFTKAS